MATIVPVTGNDSVLRLAAIKTAVADEFADEIAAAQRIDGHFVAFDAVLHVVGRCGGFLLRIEAAAGAKGDANQRKQRLFHGKKGLFGDEFIEFDVDIGVRNEVVERFAAQRVVVVPEGGHSRDVGLVGFVLFGSVPYSSR